jgi:hypothetical protein
LLLACAQRRELFIAATPGAEDLWERVWGWDEDEREGEEFHSLGEVRDLGLEGWRWVGWCCGAVATRVVDGTPGDVVGYGGGV